MNNYTKDRELEAACRLLDLKDRLPQYEHHLESLLKESIHQPSTHPRGPLLFDGF
jgi:hypothetical protein